MSESKSKSGNRKPLLNLPLTTPAPSRTRSGQAQQRASSSPHNEGRPRSTETSPTSSRSTSPRGSPALRRRHGATTTARTKTAGQRLQEQRKQMKERRAKPNIDLAWMLFKLLGIQAVNFKSELRSRDTLYDCYTCALQELKRLRGYDTFPRHVLDSLHRASLHDALRALQSVVLHLRSMDCPAKSRKKAGKGKRAQGRSPKKTNGQHSGPKPHTALSAMTDASSTTSSSMVHRTKAAAERGGARRSPLLSPQTHRARSRTSRSRSPKRRGRGGSALFVRDEGDATDDSDDEVGDSTNNSAGEPGSSSDDNSDVGDDDNVDDDYDNDDDDDHDDDDDEDGEAFDTLEMAENREGVPVGKVSRRALDKVLQRAVAHAIAAFSESEDHVSQSLALKVEVCGEAYHHPTRHAFSPGTLQRFGELVMQCQHQHQHQHQQPNRSRSQNHAPVAQLGAVRALGVLASVMQEWVSAAARDSGTAGRLTLTTGSGVKLDPALDLRWTAWHACKPSVLQASTLRSDFKSVACFDARAPWVVCGLTSGDLAITYVGTGLRVALRASVDAAHEDDVVCVCILEARARGVLFATGGADQAVAVWHASLTHAPGASKSGGAPSISAVCVSRAREHYGWVRSLAAWPEPTPAAHGSSSRVPSAPHAAGGPGPRWLLSGGGDNTTVLWSVHACVGERRGELQPVHNTFLGFTMASTSGRTAPRRATIAPGTEGTCPEVLVFHDRSRPHTHWVVGLAWLSDSLAASCSADCGLTLLWVERSPRLANVLARLWPLQRIEQAHANWPRCISHHGPFLISGSSDGAVKVWRLEEGQPEPMQNQGAVQRRSSRSGSQGTRAGSRRSSAASEGETPASRRDERSQAAGLEPLREGQEDGARVSQTKLDGDDVGGAGESSVVDARGTGVGEEENDVFGAETSEVEAVHRRCLRRASSSTKHRLSSSSQGGVAGRGRRASAVRTDPDAPHVRLACADDMKHGRGRTLALTSAHDSLLVATEEDEVLRLGVDVQTGKIKKYPLGDALAPLGPLEGQVGIRRIVYGDDIGLLFLHDHLSVLPPPEAARLRDTAADDTTDQEQEEQHPTSEHDD